MSLNKTYYPITLKIDGNPVRKAIGWFCPVKGQMAS